MSSCREAVSRHLGSWGVVFPAEFSDSEVTHTSQDHLREQHRLENKEELIDLLLSRLLSIPHKVRDWTPDSPRKKVT